MLFFLVRHWFLLLLTALIALAMAWPESCQQITAWLDERYIITAALFLMAWTLPSRSLASEVSWPWPSLWALLLSYGLLPAAAWLAGPLLPLADYHVGLLISASVPCTLASAVLWTRLAGGNEATALFVITMSTASSWLVTTTWLTATTGMMVEVKPAAMMLNLLVTLLIPVGLGQGLRAIPRCAAFANGNKTLIGGGAQFLILSIIFKAAAKVGNQLAQEATGLEPLGLLILIVVSSGLHLGVLAVGLYSSVWFGFDRPRAIAVAFASSQKTLPVALFLFVHYYQAAYPLGVAALLCFHVGQLILDTFVARQISGLREAR